MLKHTGAVVAEATDAEIFGKSVARPEVLALIFDRHGAALLRYLTGRVGAADAEDVLSEVFLIALERRAAFDPEAASAKPWLYGIASNLLHRRRRQEARYFRAMAREAQDPGIAILDDRTESRTEKRIDSQRAVASLSGALSSLSQGDRDVLLMMAWAQMTQTEIAESLQIPVGTVKSRLHRARRVLRAHLTKDLTAQLEDDDNGVQA